MPRLKSLFLGQFADRGDDEMFGIAHAASYEAVELPTWGQFFDVDQYLLDRDGYVADRQALLAKHNLKCIAMSGHLVGQGVCDDIKARHQAILPPAVWGDGDPEGVRQRAAQRLIVIGEAASQMGCTDVTGFTGSSIWPLVYQFPPPLEGEIAAGFADFAARFGPIIDAYTELGMRFDLEVHPTEIGFDAWSMDAAFTALDDANIDWRGTFGINFDPSHLLWQGIDPAAFLLEFGEFVHHVHIKDVARSKDRLNGLLGGHLSLGTPGCGWEFRSPGRGDVDWESISRALNEIKYEGPLSVEWEDNGMHRMHGIREARALLDRIDYPSSDVKFDAQFDR